MPKICITKRKITDLAAGAIITTIRSNGHGRSLTDEAITQAVNDHFHHRAKRMLPLPDGTAFRVPRTQMYGVRFDNVIFVVDDGTLTVEDLVYNALTEADKVLIGTISISIPRFDVHGAVHLLPFANACKATRAAIDKHHRDFPNSRLNMINVSFNDRTELFDVALNHM